MEQRIEEEAQERMQIWNVCQDLLVICDLEGKFLKVNPAWTATLGWHESELLGKSSQWMIHPDDREQALVETENLAAGRILNRFGLRFREKNGCYRWLSWRAVPHQGRIYAMARDETEQKHAEDGLREAQQELERVSRQTTIGAMTASIAHEINQPLAAIVANGNAGLRWLARKDPNFDEVQKALQRIVDDGRRAADVITSIRAMFSKDAHETLPLSVNGLVREVLTLIQGDLERRQIILRSELNDRLPQIMGERVPLQQVLLNLVMNAIEAMSAVTGRERLLNIQAEQWTAKRASDGRGYGMRNRSGSPRSHLQPFLFDEIPRNGLRPFHLPVNHRSARWQALGVATKSLWDGLSFNSAERRGSLTILGIFIRHTSGPQRLNGSHRAG